MAFPFYKIKSTNSPKKSNSNTRQVVVVKGDYGQDPKDLNGKEKEQIELKHIKTTLGSYEFNNGNIKVIKFDCDKYNDHIKKGAKATDRAQEVAQEADCPLPKKS